MGLPVPGVVVLVWLEVPLGCGRQQDRKSTRLNSSHDQISYAVFCLKKKKSIKNAQPVGRTRLTRAVAAEIGRVHVCTPEKAKSPLPCSACNLKRKVKTKPQGHPVS